METENNQENQKKKNSKRVGFFVITTIIIIIILLLMKCNGASSGENNFINGHKYDTKNDNYFKEDVEIGEKSEIENSDDAYQFKLLVDDPPKIAGRYTQKARS